MGKVLFIACGSDGTTRNCDVLDENCPEKSLRCEPKGSIRTNTSFWQKWVAVRSELLVNFPSK